MPKSHSSIVGGSSADRVLTCPASVPSIAALPESVDISSSYAEEGTFYHHVMDDLMRARQADNDKDLRALVRKWIGKTIYDRKLEAFHISDGVEPALDTLEKLEEIYGGGFVVLEIEREVKFPGIPGAFGTGDLLLGSKTHLIQLDWKFGSGVPVKAVYLTEDGQEEFVNAQLLFYLTAMKNTAPEHFRDKPRSKPRKLVVAISQPRTDDPLTHTTLEPEELDIFAEDLQNSVLAAVGRNPHREKGEHCRWAPCKINCPLWTGPLLDLTALGVVAPAPAVVGDAAYGEYLAKAKMLLDMALVLKPTIDEQMHSFMESGGKIPGWKLKLKSKNRAWIEEPVVVKELKKLGFKEDDIYQKKLQTFTSVDATAKRLKVEVPGHLRVAPPTNETVIALAEDAAPAVERAEAIAAFGTALKKLTKGAAS